MAFNNKKIAYKTPFHTKLSILYNFVIDFFPVNEYQPYIIQSDSMLAIASGLLSERR